MLVGCLGNEWSSSFTICACHQMADAFGDPEFGLKPDVLVKEILTFFLLSLSYSTGEI